MVGHKKNGTPIFRHAYAHTQKELTEKLHQNIERYQDVELTEDSRMTLGEWLDRWLTEYKAGTVRPGTLEGYRRYIEYYIKPQLGDKQISLLSQPVSYTHLRQENVRADHAALAGVVAVFAVILAIQSRPGSVGGRSDSGLSFTAFGLGDCEVEYCHRLSAPFLCSLG